MSWLLVLAAGAWLWMRNEQKVIPRYPGTALGPVVLVVSPHAGKAARKCELLHHLDAAGIAIGREVSISELYGLKSQGAEWRDAGFGAAIAAGGDGTVGAVATQVAGTDLPMGIVPLGTANDMARALGIPLDVRSACETLARGVAISVDAGHVRPARPRQRALVVDPADRGDAGTPPGAAGAALEEGEEVHFLHAASLGVHAEFARRATDVATRRRWGKLTYAVAVLGALTRLRATPVTLRFSGLGDREGGAGGAGHGEVVVRRRVLQLTAVNMPVFGGGWGLRVPEIHLQDRLLDFVVVEAPGPHLVHAAVEGLWSALRRLFTTVVGGASEWRSAANPGTTPGRGEARRDFSLPGVTHYKAYSAVIETPEPVDLALDGELRAHTPALIRVAPARVRVIVPMDTATATHPAAQTPRRDRG